MADTVGTGQIANALNTQQELNIRRDQVAEHKRANLAREVDQDQIFSLQERQVDMAENQQSFERKQQLRAQADKVTEFASNSMMDFYRQQEEAVSRLNEIRKQKKGLYDPKYVTGDVDTIVNADPDVKSARQRVEQLQANIDQVQDMVGRFAGILPMSSAGDKVVELFNYEVSPWERAQMTPEELQDYDKEKLAALEDFTKKHKAFNLQFMADQFAVEAQARADAEVDIHKRNFQRNLALAGAGGSRSVGVPQNVKVMQQSVASRIENFSKTIKNLPGSKKTYGSISDDLSTRVGNLDPEVFYADMYAPNAGGFGVAGYLNALYAARNRQSDVLKHLKNTQKFRENLSPNSPFHEVYDFFETINTRLGADPTEKLDKILKEGWGFETPEFNTSPTKSENSVDFNTSLTSGE